MRTFSQVRYIAFSLVLIFSAGCAVGNKHSYNDVVADLTASGTRSVGVAAHDQREYIKDGVENPNFVGTALHYDLTMKIYDQDGKVLTEKKIQGKDDLGGSSWNAPASAKQAVPRAFKEKIEELLNSTAIAAALQ